jgi:uncharacterized oxidoreductase
MPLVDTDMTRGRGSGKISAKTAALAVIGGISARRDEIWVGKSRLLRTLNRLAPGVAARLLRNG